MPRRSTTKKTVPKSAIMLLIFSLVLFISIFPLVHFSKQQQRTKAQAATNNFVRANGTQLTLGGQPYKFIGLNIYNANSRNNCWYSLGEGNGLDESLTAIGSGSNYVIRSWFFQSLATTNGTRDWTAFDHTLQVAASHGYKVIATLGNQWLDCETPQSGYRNLAWYQGGYRQVPDYSSVTNSYQGWVQEVVTRYKDNPTILMWQLMNEAEASDAKGGTCQETTASLALKSFTDDIGGLVKSIDPNHLVNIGTIGSGQCGASWTNYQVLHSSPGTDLCEYHDYHSPTNPMPGDQWNGLQTRLNQCATLNKPIFVGETGIIPSSVNGYEERANNFDAKFTTQFAAGVVGELPWDWSLNGSTFDNYDIGPNDPALSIIAKYATPLPTSIPTIPPAPTNTPTPLPTNSPTPTPTPTSTPSPTPTPLPPSPNGLKGEYFDNKNLTTLKLTRVDNAVNFNWGSGSPSTTIGSNTFSVRWTGKVQPLYSQTYTFYTTTDDGVRLWVNNQLVINKWIDQASREWNGKIKLTAGQKYDIKMEYYENGGGALAQLRWSSSSQSKQIIPQNRLFTP